MRTIAIIGAVAILTACSNSNDPGGITTPVDVIGQFGFVVGQPVNVISATRGGGASADFDQFSVTFNNAEGTSITFGTPEGENITFELDDPASWSTDLGENFPGFAKVVSADGDELEVILGAIQVPSEPGDEPPMTGDKGVFCSYRDQCENQVVLAAARLDENDTREGFETYAVTGVLTDVGDLPQSDDGGLLEGTAYYSGVFAATVFQEGDVAVDTVTGSSNVWLDFAGATVDIGLHSVSDQVLGNVNLTGSGSGDDIVFDAGVTYTGDLTGSVGDHFVTGEFGGAVFGPGDSAYDVLDTADDMFPASPRDIIATTATAGVFEANNAKGDDGLPDSSLDNAGVEIVGVFGAAGVDFVPPKPPSELSQ